MKTPTRPARLATLLTLSALLTVPALAAGHIDPKVFGHWRGALPGPGKNTPTIDLVLKPTGAETMTVNIPEHSIVEKGSYTTQPGTLTLTMSHVTEIGHPTPASRTQVLKYKVSGTTLTLDDGTKNGHVVLHRVSG